MRMNEFEKQTDEREDDFLSLSIQRARPPDDFTGEDLAFASELNTLFSPEEEELPPYYVQTLLDVEDPRFMPIEPGFEHKTSARVFRRLRLRRRLFYRHLSPLSMLSADIRDASVRRSMLALVATFVLIMLLTVAFTGPSFASGMAMLLHGKNAGGSFPVSAYPTTIHPPSHQSDWLDANVKPIPYSLARSQLLFAPYWPGSVPDAYTLQHIYLYVGLGQQWANGPMLEFEYDLPSSASASKGTGQIIVREFLPKADVLQVVEKDASESIQMGDDGRAMAIYVNGQWEPRGKSTPEWVYGTRSELIYEQNGVIFWIVGDQRDGIGKKELIHVAQGLQQNPSSFHHVAYRMNSEAFMVTQINDNIAGPFSNDVIVIFPDGGNDGPYFISVSPYLPPKNAH